MEERQMTPTNEMIYNKLLELEEEIKDIKKNITKNTVRLEYGEPPYDCDPGFVNQLPPVSEPVPVPIHLLTGPNVVYCPTDTFDAFEIPSDTDPRHISDPTDPAERNYTSGYRYTVGCSKETDTKGDPR